MKRSTLGLVGVFVALIVVAYLVTLKPGETSRTVAEGDLLLELDSASVSRIDIRSFNGEVRLEVQGDEWRMTMPIEDKADPTPVAQALSSASDMRVKGIVSTKTEKHGIFQVDSTGTTVTFHTRHGEEQTIIIGKASSSFSETYVRREGSSDVALVDGSLSFMFSKPANDWRDRAVLSLPEGSVAGLQYLYGDTAVSISFQDSVWMVNGMMANQSSVTSLIASLSDLTGDGFLDAPPSRRPMATLTVSGLTVSFVFDPAEKKYSANRSGDDRWITLPDWRANQVLKREKDLL